MARPARLDVFQRFLRDGLVVTLQEGDRDLAVAIAKALIRGGVRVIELLDRESMALDTFRMLQSALRPAHADMLIGVGSIVDAPTAALFLAHGADFVVGPGLADEVVRLCNRRKVACIPGCGTVSEIARAEELGCEIVKLFPAAALDGPEFLRSLRGPMPWSRVMPTGNSVPFDEASIREWFAAGACAISMGASLVEPALVAARDFAAIAERAARVIGWIAAARGK